MNEGSARLCQMERRWGQLVLAGSLAALGLGCGATSRNPSDGEPRAGSSGAMSAGGETAAAAGLAASVGGRAPSVGGMGESASPTIGGQGGASPTIGGTGSGISGSANATGGFAACTGESWPADCAPTCAKPMAGCLLNDANQLPSDSVSIEAQVVSAEELEPGAKVAPCIGFQGPESADGPSTLVSLEDADGKSWSLWFPTRLLLADRFAGGTTLQVSYVRRASSIFSAEHELVVSEADQVVAFVAKTNRAFPVIANVDVAVHEGELACPWTADACTEARAHTEAASGDEKVTDPCGSALGGFEVSSLAHLATGRTCGGNSCDVASSYYLSGVRVQP